MSNIIEQTRSVYEKLQDDYSRFIYEERLLYSLTGNLEHMNKVSRSVLNISVLNKIMEKISKINDKLIVRGAGNDYWVIKEMFPDFDFKYFCDNDPSKIGSVRIATCPRYFR